MEPEEIWYFIGLTDQIRDLLLCTAYSTFFAIVGRYLLNKKAEYPKGYFLMFLVLSASFTLRALVPNKELSREIAAIKYGRELQQKRVQDKLFFYKKELNKEKK